MQAKLSLVDRPGVSPIIFNDPGISSLFVGYGFIELTSPRFYNDNLNVVYMSVDVNDPQNQEPSPQLDDNEFIECFSLPRTSLHDVYLIRLARQGLGVDARVGTLRQKEVNWRDDGSYSCRH